MCKLSSPKYIFRIDHFAFNFNWINLKIDVYFTHTQFVVCSLQFAPCSINQMSREHWTAVYLLFLLYRMSNVHNPQKYEINASQSLNRCSKLWLQVTRSFRRWTYYEIFQQFTVRCTHVHMYIVRYSKTFDDSDFWFFSENRFILPPNPPPLAVSHFWFSVDGQVQYYLFEYLHKYYLIVVVQLKSMGKRMAILIIIHGIICVPKFVCDGLGWQHTHTHQWNGSIVSELVWIVYLSAIRKYYLTYLYNEPKY